MSRTIRAPREFHRIVVCYPYGVLTAVEISTTNHGWGFTAEFKDSTGYFAFGTQHIWTRHAMDAAYTRGVSVETYLADEAVRFARREVGNKWGATATFGRSMDAQITYRGQVETDNRAAGAKLHPFAVTFSDEYKDNVRRRHSGAEWLR